MTNETKAPEGKNFKMLSTQPGVRHGDIHPVVFHKDKTYALDDSLRDQFQLLNAIEPSTDDPEEPGAHSDAPINDPDFGWVEKEPLNEGVLDEDPGVLRHAEIPVEAVIAQNDQAAANGDMTPTAAAVLGREDIAGELPDEGKDDAADQKATAKKTKKK